MLSESETRTFKMSEKKYWSMTKAGGKQIKDLKLSSEEITAMQMALDGSLDKEHNKRGKITKPVLCSLLQKIIPETKWFEQSTSANEADKEAEEKALKEALEAVASDVTTSQDKKAICRYFDAGNCKYGKGQLKGQVCPEPHPPTCKAFDRKGKEGCKETPCPQGKHHRRVCPKFMKGACTFKDNCRYYHPPQLGKEIEAKKKKKQEEEAALAKEQEEKVAFLGHVKDLEQQVAHLKMELKAREGERDARVQAIPLPLQYYQFPQVPLPQPQLFPQQQPPQQMFQQLPQQPPQNPGWPQHLR